jgi:hyperosmotically inducible periplasmic protein
MKTRILALTTALLLIVGLGIACSNKNKSAANVDDSAIKDQLKQANLNDVKVKVDNDKRVVSLDGNVQTDDQKAQAEQIAKSAAPDYVVSNEIGVRPENASNAGKVDSNLDDAIKSDWKALEAKNNWGNQHISTDVKNGVLTLKGDVDTQDQRTTIEKAAAKIPNVTQVVNELDVKSAKHNKKSAAQSASE